tara:strand:- start:253 stop:465 length:213 start_codon:yes stop_codon:yes gene_type:complete
MNNSLPEEMNNLLDTEQHILNRLLGECVPIQEVAEEMMISEGAVQKLADKVWLSLSITSRQQFIRFWKST